MDLPLVPAVSDLNERYTYLHSCSEGYVVNEFKGWMNLWCNSKSIQKSIVAESSMATGNSDREAEICAALTQNHAVTFSRCHRVRHSSVALVKREAEKRQTKPEFPVLWARLG